MTGFLLKVFFYYSLNLTINVLYKLDLGKMFLLCYDQMNQLHFICLTECQAFYHLHQLFTVSSNIFFKRYSSLDKVGYYNRKIICKKKQAESLMFAVLCRYCWNLSERGAWKFVIWGWRKERELVCNLIKVVYAALVSSERVTTNHCWFVHESIGFGINTFCLICFP